MFLPLSTIAVSTTPAKKETNYINQQRDVSNSLSFFIKLPLCGKQSPFPFFFKVQETYTISQRFGFNKFLHNGLYVNNNIGCRPQFKTTASISKLSCLGFHC